MNTIEATEFNVRWLIDRLYVESRHLKAIGVESPVFVLLSKNADARDAVEALIYDHLRTIYGDALDNISPDARFKTSTIFTLPVFGSRVMLMDVNGGT